MDFKVDVSLWNQASLDGRQQPNLDSDASSGFRDKLALDNGVPPPAQQPEPLVVVQPLLSGSQLQAPFPAMGLEAYQRLDACSSNGETAANQQGHGEVDAVELYKLGALAGHHLSYLLARSTASTCAIATAGPAPFEASVAVVNAQLSPMPQASDRPEVEPTGFTEIPAQQPMLDEPVLTSPAQQLQRYLSTQWAERRMQVIAHGNDEILLLIRDYHLAADEQEALVADLRHQLAAMPKQPAQVWLNGQSIWQPPVQPTRSNRHGS